MARFKGGRLFKRPPAVATSPQAGLLQRLIHHLLDHYRSPIVPLSDNTATPRNSRTGRPMWFYLNGRFVEDEDAKVPVTDHSFLYGDGCFEGIGVCDGRIMHLRRACRSLVQKRPHAAHGGARSRQTNCTISSLRLHCVTAWRSSKMGYLRPLLSRGAGPLGIKYSQQAGPRDTRNHSANR